MWNSSCGEKVFSGVKRELIRNLIDGMVDGIEMSRDIDEAYAVGVLLFDNLQPEQQMAMLHRVANALLREDVPEPDLTAVNEATVYAIFRELFIRTEIEIDNARLGTETGLPFFDSNNSPYEIRSKILAAYEQNMTNEELEEFRQEGFIPDLKCCDSSEWNPVIEGLADQILWDRDFEMEYLMVDSAPESSELLKAHMGIDEGYFTAIAGDLHTTSYEKTRDAIRDLVRN